MDCRYGEWRAERTAGMAAAEAALTAEIPLPPGRTAARVLHAEAAAENRVAQVGEGSIAAEGTVEVQLLIEPTDGGPVYGLRSTAVYRENIPAPGAESGMRAVVTPTITELTCRVESGKLLLRGMLALSACLIDSRPVRVLEGCGEGMALRKGTLTAYAEAPLGAASAHLEAELPGAERVLLQGGDVEITGILPEEGGLLVSAELFLHLLAAEEDERLASKEERIAFEERIPTERVADPNDVRIVPALRDLSVTPSEEGGLDCEAVVELRAYETRAEPLEVVLDAYSLDGAYVAEQTCVALPAVPIEARETIRERVALPEEASRAVYAAARPVVTGAAEAEGKLGVDGVLFLDIVYETDAGGVGGYEEEIPFQCRLSLPDQPGARIEAQAGAAHVVGGGRLADVTIPLRFSITPAAGEACVATGLMETESVVRPAGILIHIAGEGEDCFAVGKQFALPEETVRLWNPSCAEPFREGEPLVLLRRPHETA